jgi:soluble lytic murein transglycosylase
VTEHIDKLMAMPDVANGWFSNKGVPMLSMKARDISSADKEGLTNSFKKQGITDPTDAQILGAYWMKKVTRK